ncbi:MAG TPA: hypothetical protein VKB77_11325 [Terriglobales bacterium]|nr:hypothetical protein [Terriglobales bacterium]
MATIKKHETTVVVETPPRRTHAGGGDEPPAEPVEAAEPKPEERPGVGDRLPGDPQAEPKEPPAVEALAAPTANVSPSTVTVQSTHFTGPVASGNVGLGYQGYALLCKRFDFDVTKGAIPASIQVNLPVAPPSNCLLLDVRRIMTTALDNAVNLTIGTTIGGVDLLASTALTIGNLAPVQILPVAPTPTKFWLNFSNVTTAPTVGKFSLLLTYART